MNKFCKLKTGSFNKKRIEDEIYGIPHNDGLIPMLVGNPSDAPRHINNAIRNKKDPNSIVMIERDKDLYEQLKKTVALLNKKLSISIPVYNCEIIDFLRYCKKNKIKVSLVDYDSNNAFCEKIFNEIEEIITNNYCKWLAVTLSSRYQDKVIVDKLFSKTNLDFIWKYGCKPKNEYTLKDIKYANELILRGKQPSNYIKTAIKGYPKLNNIFKHYYRNVYGKEIRTKNYVGAGNSPMTYFLMSI